MGKNKEKDFMDSVEIPNMEKDRGEISGDKDSESSRGFPYDER